MICEGEELQGEEEGKKRVLTACKVKEKKKKKKGRVNRIVAHTEENDPAKKRRGWDKPAFSEGRNVSPTRRLVTQGQSLSLRNLFQPVDWETRYMGGEDDWEKKKNRE